jgi:hypothetical protein
MMRVSRFLKPVISVGIAVLMMQCGQVAEKEKARVVARAGSEELDFERYRRSFIESPYVKDSSFNAKRSIESWAVEALFYQEALEKLQEEEMQIEEKVADYRKALVNYIYQTRLVDANLDTVVSAEEIENYYRENSPSFILKENIVKVDYLKVPVRAPALEKIRKLLGSTRQKDQEQLAGLLSQNAENFFMNDSTWLYLDDIRKEIPQLADEPEYVFSPGRTMEFTDDDYFYYLKIRDVKTKNALSPLNFEKANIRRFILNNRKTQLISEYKRQLLEGAKKDRKFVVY